MIDNKVVIGRRIARLRNSENLTQEQLAEKINLSSNEISNLERAKNNLSYNTLVDLCNALNVCPCELLCGAIHSDVDDNIVDLIKHMDYKDKYILYELLLKFDEIKNNLNNN